MHRESKQRSVAGQLSNGTSVYYRWHPTDIAHNVRPEILAQVIKEVSVFRTEESFCVYTMQFDQPLGVKTIEAIKPDNVLKWFRRPGHGSKLFLFAIGKRPEVTSTLTVEIYRQQNGRYTLVRAYLGEAIKLTKGKRFPQCFAYTNEEPRIGKSRKPGVRDKFRPRR